MGKDAYIYFRGQPPADLDLPPGYYCYEPSHPENSSQYEQNEIWCSADRLWTPEYPRGPWLKLSWVLKQLLEAGTVVSVHYGEFPGVGSGDNFTLGYLVRYDRAYWARTAIPTIQEVKA